MSRNWTQEYERYGDDDFNIYDGEDEESDITTHQEEYFANGGMGFFHETCDDAHITAIVADAVDTAIRDEATTALRTQALQHSDDLNTEMTEEEYKWFIEKQEQEKHRYILFQPVLDEIMHYVPDMLRSREEYLTNQGIAISHNLMKLDEKKLFYY